MASAAGGQIPIITQIQGGQDLWQANADYMLNKYGYKTQGARYKYGQRGTSRTKAGLISGAYTDLSKELETPEMQVKSKDFGTLNTLDTIVSMGSALVQGSAGAMRSNLQQPATKPTPKPANQLGMFDTGGNMKPMLYPELGNQMGTKDFSTPLDNPSLISGLKPNVPSDATFSMNEDTPDDLTPSGGGLSLQGGGKNKGGAVPVEAEGGEWEVAFDKAYNIKNIIPVVGAKHEQGGVDLKLPKNHAILNKMQYTRLQQGESLKSILDSVPSVKEVGKAQTGADNPPDDEGNVYARTPEWKLIKGIGDWMGSFGNTPPDLPEMSKYGKGKMGGLPLKPENKEGRPATTSKESEPFISDNPLVMGVGAGSKIGASWISGGVNPNFKAGLNDISLIHRSTDEGGISKVEPLGIPKTVDGGIPNPEESLLNVKSQYDVYPGSVGTRNKFQFGYPEKATLANALQNLVAMLQPRAKGVTVGSPPSQTPTMVSSHPQNPKATLDEIGKQFKAGLAQLQQTGQTHLIPSLIRSSMDATSKVGEQYAANNIQAEVQSQAENARTSNQMSMQRTGIDADTIWKNATMELETLKMQGQQDSERYRAVQSLIGSAAGYDRLKQEEQMRNAVYARLMVEQYSRPT